MKKIVFTPDEEAVLRNLPLLAKASQEFMQLGLPPLMYRRLYACIKQFACKELHLRWMPHESGSNVSEDNVNHQRWPHLEISEEWCGFAGSPDWCPRLWVRVGTTGVPIAQIDYKPFSKQHSLTRAKALMSEYGFSPEKDDVWFQNGREPVRCNSEWYFRPCPVEESDFDVDYTALLRDNRPAPLCAVSPKLCMLMEDYVRQCRNFWQMIKQERMALGKALKIIAAPFTWPKFRRDFSLSQTRALRMNAGGLVAAMSIWEDRGSWDPEVIDSCQKKASTAIEGVIERVCQLHQLHRCGEDNLFVNRIVNRPTGFPSKGSAFRHSRNPYFEYLAPVGIRLAMEVQIPELLDDRDVFEVKAGVCLNGLVQGRSAKAMQEAVSRWETSGAKFALDSLDPIYKEGRTRESFWGYLFNSDSMALDMDCLVNKSKREGALPGLIKLLEALDAAMRSWSQCTAR